MALSPRQRRLYQYEATICRQLITTVSGSPSGTWTVVSSGTPCFIEHTPNFFETHDFVQGQTTLVVTTDILSFEANSDIRAADEIVITKTPPDGISSLGRVWHARGAGQDRPIHAHKLEIFASEQEASPAGITVTVSGSTATVSLSGITYLY
jgi:hypothetical protein